MELEQTRQALKRIIEERLGIRLAEVKAGDDDELFDEEGWGIDSVDVLDLVLGIEKTFGVRLKQDNEVQKHFRSINTLAAFIHELKPEGAKTELGARFTGF
jgi:acyl carrier protein